jgi:hypothetical protein
MNRVDRFGAWLLTGPVGRFAAFLLDLGSALISAMRRRRQAP